MTTFAEKHTKEERQHIDVVVDKLVKHHPGLPADTVAKVVDEAYHFFDEQPIRDFVPLLVERRARGILGDTVPTATPESVIDDLSQ